MITIQQNSTRPHAMVPYGLFMLQACVVGVLTNRGKSAWVCFGLNINGLMLLVC